MELFEFGCAVFFFGVEVERVGGFEGWAMFVVDMMDCVI